MLLTGKTLRRIVATRVERVAAADAEHASPRASPRAVFLNGTDEIIAARRSEAALTADKRAQRPLVKPHEPD